MIKKFTALSILFLFVVSSLSLCAEVDKSKTDAKTKSIQTASECKDGVCTIKDKEGCKYTCKVSDTKCCEKCGKDCCKKDGKICCEDCCMNCYKKDGKECSEKCMKDSKWKPELKSKDKK